MDRNYGGVIWTNHVMDRMRERGIKQGDAWATWRNPAQSRKGRIPGSWVYYRTYGTTTIEVVAKKNEKGQWIILSVWSRTDYKGAPVSKRSFWDLIFGKLFKEKGQT